MGDEQRDKDQEVPFNGPEGTGPGTLCQICRHGQTSAHHNFGAYSCFSCRAFFRRLVTKHKNPRILCQFDNNCDVFGENRNNCRRCRYEACIKAGMNPDLVLNVEQRKERLLKLGATPKETPPKAAPPKRAQKRPSLDPLPGHAAEGAARFPALSVMAGPPPLEKMRPVTLAPIIDTNLMATALMRAKAVADANPANNPRRIVEDLWQRSHMEHKVMSLKLAWKMAEEDTERPSKLKVMHMISCYPTKIYEPQTLMSKHYKEISAFLESFALNYPSFSELVEGDRKIVLEVGIPIFFSFLMFKTLATGLSAWLTLDRERYGSDKPNGAISITSIGDLMAMTADSVSLQGRIGVTFSTMRFKAFDVNLEHLELVAHASLFNRQVIEHPRLADPAFLATVEKDNDDFARHFDLDPNLLRDATDLCHRLSQFWPIILGTGAEQLGTLDPVSDDLAQYEDSWLEHHANSVERKSKEYAPTESFIRDLMGLHSFATPFPYDPIAYLHDLWRHRIVTFMSDSEEFCALPVEDQRHLCRLNSTLGFAMQCTQLENASTFGEQLLMLSTRHRDVDGPEGVLPPGADDSIMQLPAVKFENLQMSRYMSQENHAALVSEVPKNAPFLTDKKTAAGLLLFLLITNLDTFLVSKGRPSREGDKYLQAVRRRLQKEGDISQERLNRFLLEISQFWQVCDNIFNSEDTEAMALNMKMPGTSHQ